MKFRLEVLTIDAAKESYFALLRTRLDFLAAGYILIKLQYIFHTFGLVMNGILLCSEDNAYCWQSNTYSSKARMPCIYDAIVLNVSYCVAQEEDYAFLFAAGSLL